MCIYKNIFIFIFFLPWSPSSDAFNPIFPDHSLVKNKDKIMEKLKKRLEIYDATKIDLVYGKSPRKFIKNIFVYYNGYYTVNFHSKKDKLDYNCDINIGHSFKGTAMSGNADVYLMNCKNKNDSLTQPTELLRVFEDQHPNEAIKGSVKFINRPITNTFYDITLLDNWSYDVEYKRVKDSRRVRCTAFLQYYQMPTNLVDQRMNIEYCTELDPIEKLPEDQEIRCIPDPIPVLSKTMTRFAGELSDYYVKELSKKWPLPKKEEVKCSSPNIDYWKELAEKMISLKEVKLKSNTLHDQKLEKIMLENSLINQAYGRLYLESRKNPAKVNNLNWLSVASHSSPMVGVGLRKGYLNTLSRDELRQRNGLEKVAYTDQERSLDDSILASYFSKRKDVVWLLTSQREKTL